MPILQIHQQPKDLSREKETEFIAQREISSHEQFERFCEETLKNHLLPEGMQWLFVPEGSEFFWRVAL